MQPSVMNSGSPSPAQCAQDCRIIVVKSMHDTGDFAVCSICARVLLHSPTGGHYIPSWHRVEQDEREAWARIKNNSNH